MIVEDGSVVTGANSLVPLTFADQFFGNRGDTRWTGTAARREALLIRGTDWLVQRFGQRFLGSPVDTDQELPWPRQGVYVDNILLPDDAIPNNVQKAICIYALRAIEFTDFSPDPRLPQDLLDSILPRSPDDPDAVGGGPVVEKTTEAGKLKTKTRYADTSLAATSNSYSLGSIVARRAFDNIRAIPEGDMFLTGLIRGSVLTGSNASAGGAIRA